MIIEKIQEAVVEYVKAFIHNVFVHPLMMLMPRAWADRFHNWNWNMLYGKDK